MQVDFSTSWFVPLDLFVLSARVSKNKLSGFSAPQAIRTVIGDILCRSGFSFRENPVAAQEHRV